jgi:hypothetical protein
MSRCVPSVTGMEQCGGHVPVRLPAIPECDGNQCRQGQLQAGRDGSQCLGFRCSSVSLSSSSR